MEKLSVGFTIYQRGGKICPINPLINHPKLSKNIYHQRNTLSFDMVEIHHKLLNEN